MKFEERLGDLEAIVGKLEASDLPLEEALALFEKGIGLVRDLTRQLDEVERRLEALVRSDDGTLSLQTLDESERDD
jgi:exodeoxyribonuclease VII small subunit